MFWVDSVVEKVTKRYASQIRDGIPLIIRDEKTLSGRVHVGSLRGVAIHGAISEYLTKLGIKNKYLFEINDFDPMDGLPVYLDQEKFLPYMGKPLCDIPSPEGDKGTLTPKGHKAKNFAEYFAGEFIGVIKEIGFEPEFYRSSDLYRSGKYNNFIKLAIENADAIRKIYKDISGSEKEEQWLPIHVICEKCGKIGTTRAVSFDGKLVEYSCGDFVKWGKGCGHSGKISPFDGNAKLSWKVEWAAKFSILNVDIEGGGKDHTTKGGSRDIAVAISREIFKRQPPVNIPYEFFLVGGKKMSSSKGAGSSSREVADLLPPEILRFLLVQKEPQRVIDFIPDGDTVPVLYDTYDTFAKNYWKGSKDDYAKVFELSHVPYLKTSLLERVLPRFSQVAYLVQMPHVNMQNEMEKLEGKVFNDLDNDELNLRAKYAKIWLDDYAPEDYKFEIQKEMPDKAKSFSAIQKSALSQVLEFIESKNELDGQDLHTTLHAIKTDVGIPPQDFFSALYISILGKDSGPKAGWFLSVLDKNFLIKRLKEVIHS